MGRKLNKKGVSLAELLAVVVIMGIIAAIAIPLVGNVITTSKKKAYLGDLVTVTEAARTYCIAEGTTKNTKYCTNQEYVVGETQAGDSQIFINKGLLVPASANTGKQEDINAAKGAVSTELDLYMSKKAAKVSETIELIQINNKFFVKSTTKGNGQFMIGTGAEFIDPTDSDALENINEKTGA